MTKSAKNIIQLGVVIIAFAGLAFYIYRDLNKAPEKLSKISEPGVSIETNSAAGPGKGYTVNVIKNGTETASPQKVKTPDLNLSAVDYGHLDPAAFKIVAENVVALSATLKKDPTAEDKWLSLSISRKILSDYKAAIAVLDYVAAVWPNDYVPYNNLADIYQNYDKNYKLAERNWLKVIQLNPGYVQAYENLYSIYSDPSYGGGKAKELPTLLLGLKNNPGSIDLMVYIARYYRSIGDKADAKMYYDMAVAQAKARDNASLAALLQTEEDSI